MLIGELAIGRPFKHFLVEDILFQLGVFAFPNWEESTHMKGCLSGVPKLQQKKRNMGEEARYSDAAGEDRRSKMWNWGSSKWDLKEGDSWDVDRNQVW